MGRTPKGTTPLQRFWAKVDTSHECWLWTAGRNTCGYGSFWADGQMQQAHRWIFEQLHGELASGIEVCHTCDQPACVRDEHLFAADHLTNMLDSIQKGRSRLPDPPQGEANFGAKLNATHVSAIRAAYSGQRGQVTELADLYGVSLAAISHIVNRKSWRHLAEVA